MPSIVHTRVDVCVFRRRHPFVPTKQNTHGTQGTRTAGRPVAGGDGGDQRVAGGAGRVKAPALEPILSLLGDAASLQSCIPTPHAVLGEVGSVLAEVAGWRRQSSPGRSSPPRRPPPQRPARFAAYCEAGMTSAVLPPCTQPLLSIFFGNPRISRPAISATSLSSERGGAALGGGRGLHLAPQLRQA